jgi:hypothetical protein
VAKGFAQVDGVDYNETFAPVAVAGSLRIFMAASLSTGKSIYQFDVETAFLYGELEESNPIYIIAPR